MGTFQGRETYLKDKLSLGNADADCTVTAEAMCMPKEHSTIATHEDQDAAIVSASEIPTTTESVSQDLLRSGRQVKVSCSFHVSILTTYNFGIHIDRCFCVSLYLFQSGSKRKCSTITYVPYTEDDHDQMRHWILEKIKEDGQPSIS